MSDVNTVSLTGRLTRDPETIAHGKGTRFAIAANRAYRKQGADGEHFAPLLQGKVGGDQSAAPRRLTLIDLGRLVELWIEHSPKLDDADRQRLPLKPIYFLSPSE